jgi:UDPglucose 6-dehydrogenase
VIDLSYIRSAVREIGLALSTKPSYHVVGLKSTVVPSTTDMVVRTTLEKASGKALGEFGLCTNPEFLREGDAIRDFLRPDRIVIGSNDERSFQAFKRIYSSFRCPIVRTNLRTAEMIKYATNSLLASLISYSNEIASIAEAVGDIDVVEIMNGLHLDSRLMPFDERSVRSLQNRIVPGIIAYLKAGCGYGGSCLPKDLQALCAFAEKSGANPDLLRSVIRINERQPLKLMERLNSELGGVANKKIAVWGLTFKAETDDVRNTPAKPIIDFLLKRGARVSAYDPIGGQNAKAILFKDSSLRFAKTKTEAVSGADALIVVTSWPEFRKVNFKKLSKLMKKSAILVDGRRIYDRKSVSQAGLNYLGVGYRELREVI